MKTKSCLVLTISILMITGLLITTVAANSSWPNLPSTLVDLKLTHDLSANYPFEVQLSNVPVGFDVTDGSYVGWCVDIEHTIQRNIIYPVWLYSSLAPPAELATIEWDMINYILNHQQGTDANDTQAAIWYFINGRNYFWYEFRDPQPSPMEDAMIIDAVANGVGYTPGVGEVLAIICLPDDDENVQMPIIEVTIPGLEGLTPGFWKNHVDLWEGYSAGDKFSDVFGVAITIDLGKKSVNSNPTLLDALKAKGGVNEEMGIYDALARHAVAALLNAAHPDVDYPMIEQAIIAEVKNAIENALMDDAEPLKDLLESYNKLGGGIDAHGNPI